MVRPRAHFKNLGSFIEKYVPRTTTTVTNDATAAAMAHLEVARRGGEQRDSSMDVVPDRAAATGKGKHIANSGVSSPGALFITPASQSSAAQGTPTTA